MSKTTVAIGILGATATVAVAAPTALLLGGGGEGEGGGRGSYKEPSWAGKMPELASATDIKNKYTEINCLKEYFGTGVNWDQYNEQSNDNPNINSIEKENDNLKSCLIVEYYKRPYTADNKWWGGFRLIWSVANDKEGLVTVFNSDAKDGSFKFDSSVYVIEKGSDSNWSSKYKHEKTVKEVITEETVLLKKFPQASNSISASGQDYWGFSPVPNKVCKVNECPESKALDPNKTDKPHRWDWKKNGGKAITDWCKNFDDWFKSLLPDGKDATLKTQLAKLKGSWTKQSQQ